MVELTSNAVLPSRSSPESTLRLSFWKQHHFQPVSRSSRKTGYTLDVYASPFQLSFLIFLR